MTRSFSVDDETLGTLGNKHAKVYQLKDAPATGLSHSTNHYHSSDLPFEMYTLESGEPPSRTLNWKRLGFLRQCVCNVFHYDSFGDHIQTCQVKSVASQTHDWVMYRLGVILGSVGQRDKIHKITSVTGKERGDLEIKDYVVLQNPQEQADRLPPPRTLILDFTLTHTHYGSSQMYTTGQLTSIQNTKCSDDAPELDGALRVVSRKKILYYC